MDYLRRYRGDVNAAASAYRSEVTISEEESAAAEPPGRGTAPASLATGRRAAAQMAASGSDAAQTAAVQTAPASGSDAAAGAEATEAGSEFWLVAAAPVGDDTPCAICLASLQQPTSAAGQGLGRLVGRLRCNHYFHISCIKLCVASGALVCPLCRQTVYSLARQHVMEASAEGEAAAAAVAASQGQQRLRLQQRLAERRAARDAARQSN